MKFNFKEKCFAIRRCGAILLLLAMPLLACGQDNQPVLLQEALIAENSVGESQIIAHPLRDLDALFKLNGTVVVVYTPPAKPNKKNQKVQKYDITRIGDRGIGKGINFYSLHQEQELGRELSEEVEANSKMITDPVVIAYIQRLGQRLVNHSDAQIAFVIKVVDSDEINAFALPGGYFYVNSGLILAADNEAELAAAMAHEIAHVAARHATRSLTKSQLWGFASVALTVVGGPAGLLIHQVADIAMPMTFLKFGRNEEREADLLGLEYQYAAGYDPLAFVNFFERISVHEKKESNKVSRLFASHPITSDRIKRAQIEIATLLPRREQYVISTSEFDDVKSRLTTLTIGIRAFAKSDDSKPTLRRGRPDQTQTDGSGADTEGPTLHRKQ
jgi:beta-barrel assembly-enhancing protease